MVKKGSPIKSKGSLSENKEPHELEFARPMTAVRIFDVPRYRIFELIRAKAIRTTTIRRPGSKRHMRLIDMKSLREYLNKNAVEAAQS
jgi:hypothetical protein